MTEATDFGGLFCELSLPLEWSPVTGVVHAAPAQEIVNQNCLRTILGLDESASLDLVDDSADIGHELQRLDFKINVILELVAKMAIQNCDFPEAVEIKLGPGVIQWYTSSAAPKVDQQIQLKIYPDPRFPFPLVLSVDVLDVHNDADNSLVTCSINFVDEQTKELLEKYIFRCHRRHVAKIKSLKSE